MRSTACKVPSYYTVHCHVASDEAVVHTLHARTWDMMDMSLHIFRMGCVVSAHALPPGSALDAPLARIRMMASALRSSALE